MLLFCSRGIGQSSLWPSNRVLAFAGREMLISAVCARCARTPGGVCGKGRVARTAVIHVVHPAGMAHRPRRQVNSSSPLVRNGKGDGHVEQKPYPRTHACRWFTAQPAELAGSGPPIRQNQKSFALVFGQRWAIRPSRFRFALFRNVDSFDSLITKGR